MEHKIETQWMGSMIKKAMPVTWSVIYNNQEAFNNDFKQLQKEEW